MSSSPETSTNGDQTWPAADRALDGLMTTAVNSPAIPRPANHHPSAPELVTLRPIRRFPVADALLMPSGSSTRPDWPTVGRRDTPGQPHGLTAGEHPDTEAVSQWRRRGDDPVIAPTQRRCVRLVGCRRGGSADRRRTVPRWCRRRVRGPVRRVRRRSAPTRPGRLREQRTPRCRCG